MKPAGISRFSIVMQLAKIHGKEEGSKLDPMVQEFVLQLPQLQPARSKEQEIVEAFFVGIS